MSVGHKEHLDIKENIQQISLGGRSEHAESGFLGNETRSWKLNLTDGLVSWLVTALGKTMLSSGLSGRPIALPAENKS